MEREIVTDESQREVKMHGTAEFPFSIGYEDILYYDGKRFACHWHKEIELAYVYSGKIKIQVNHKDYIVSAGECLFSNANALHMGWAIDDQSCSYFAITLDPSMFGREEGIIRKRYIDPILENPSLPSFLFHDDGDWQSTVLEKIRGMELLYRERPLGFELEITALLLSVWKLFYINEKDCHLSPDIHAEKYDRMKSILSYIHGNYRSKITLYDMARAANVSKSECSHSFKDYMRETPFEYLLRYRVEQSIALLEKPDGTITETALSVGFTSASYYTEVFKRYMGITPREYKRARETGK
ncbi:AraC family transcriptional regulator [Marasmitruncus massiliensis]|uniref:AraC family transcriptional regulator n=1 Tax=Marasmitruncus massiliensis TaxID=1944642 RepID=UPI000C79A445|nr:AraC family transcriptional regulator [Marasmitruncus massiliensis]